MRHSYLPALLLGACTGAETSPDFVARDSVGIRITESARPLWTANNAWRLAERPTLEIGVEEGDREYQLYRVTGAHRFADGSVVISNSGSHELRFYDAAGRFRHAVGRQGGGPGEFGQFSSMRFWVDSDGRLRVEDGYQDRINVLDRAGSHRATIRLEATADFPRAFPLDVLGDGSWLAWAPQGGGQLQGTPGSIITSEFAWARYGNDGRWIGELFRRPGQPRYVHQFGNIVHYPYIPLTAAPAATGMGDRIAAWMGPHAEIVVLRFDGTVAAVIRWQPPRSQSVAGIWDRFREAELAQAPNDRDRRTYAHYFNLDIPLPDQVPTVSRLLTDTDGNLWAEHYRLPWDAVPRWDVFNPEGRWLGDVAFPAGFRVLEIGVDYALGRHRDELGVERVHVYDLHKRR